MEVNARRPSRVYAEISAEELQLQRNSDPEQGSQPMLTLITTGDLDSTLKRSSSWTPKGNPGTPRGGSNSFSGFNKRRLRSWHFQMSMAFAVGVLLTYMFAHHPNSPVPTSLGRKVSYQRGSYPMTVSANERQLASEALNAQRRISAEVDDRESQYRSASQLREEVAASSQPRLSPNKRVAVSPGVSHGQQTAEQRDWHAVELSESDLVEGDKGATIPKQALKDLPKDLRYDDPHAEDRRDPASGLGRRSRGNAATHVEVAASHTQQPKPERSRSRTRKGVHRLGRLNRTTADGAATSPAVAEFLESLHRPESSADDHRVKDAAALRSAVGASERGNGGPHEKDQSSEALTISGQEGFVVSSAVFNDIVKGRDHEAFVDVPLETEPEADESELSSEEDETPIETLERVGSTAKINTDMLDFILDGATQEVRTVNGIINADIEDGDEVHSFVQFEQQPDLIADASQDQEASSEPEAAVKTTPEPESETGKDRGSQSGGAIETGPKESLPSKPANGVEISGVVVVKDAGNTTEIVTAEGSRKGHREAEAHATGESNSGSKTATEEAAVQGQAQSGGLEIVFDIEDNGPQLPQIIQAGERQLSEGNADPQPLKAELVASSTHVNEADQQQPEAVMRADETVLKADELARTQEEPASAKTEAAREAMDETARRVQIAKAQVEYVQHLEEVRPRFLAEVMEASMAVTKEQADADRQRLSILTGGSNVSSSGAFHEAEVPRSESR